MTAVPTVRSAAVAVAIALAPAPGFAQRRPVAGMAAGRGTVAETLPFAQAVEALRAGDPDRVRLAIDSLSTLRTAAVVAPLVDLLHSGPSDDITDYTVQQLGNIGRAEAIDELAALLQHRRSAVRVAAVVALARINDPRVRSLVETGLHDSEPEVRGHAAEALGEIDARASVPILFRAFERGVPEAAESIGRLGDGATAVSPDAATDRDDPRTTTRPHTLAMWLGRAPLSVLLRGFGRFLRRNEINAVTKEQIIVRLEQQASAQVRDFLVQWVASLPATYHGRDRQRAELAIQQIRVPATGAR